MVVAGMTGVGMMEGASRGVCSVDLWWAVVEFAWDERHWDLLPLLLYCMQTVDRVVGTITSNFFCLMICPCIPRVAQGSLALNSSHWVVLIVSRSP